MRALILKNKNKLSIEERELAALSDFDVLIKVEVACVCGSDFRLLNQDKIHDIVLGHEFSGTVLRSGKGVKEKLVGKRVTVFPMFSCLDCDSCKSERHRDCDNKMTPSPALCLVCQVRRIDASVPGGKTCSFCSEMLIKTNGDQSQESSKGNLVTGES